jgi:O-antigen/teichoic acid export membrane protein
MSARGQVIQRLKSVAWTGLAVLLARILSFSLFVFAARTMSQEDNAGLIYVVGMSQLVIQLGTLGWLNLIRRMAARLDREVPDLARGFVQRSLQVPCLLVTSICTALAIAALSGWFDPALSKTVLYTAILAFPLLINSILREYLAGFNYPTTSVLLSDTLPFGLTIAVLLAVRQPDLEVACACLVTGLTVSIAIQLKVIGPRLRSVIVKADCAAFHTEAWSKIAALTVVGFGGKLLMDRMDTLLLAPIAGLDQLAYFNSATRLTSLLLLVPIILIPVFAPRISTAFHAHDLRQLRFDVFLQVAAVAVTVVPAAIVLQFSPQSLIAAIFGEKYASAGDIMWLIIIAQVLFAFALPFSNLLIMTNGEAPYATASIIGFAANFLSGLILIPHYTVWGAAVATAIGTASLSLVLVAAGGSTLQLWPGIHYRTRRALKWRG